MNAETRPDYRRVKVAALQQLAAGGDQAAAQELARRGIAATLEVDVTTLDYHGLRRLVLAWRDGVIPDERERNRALAERAQAELVVRYRVDSKLWDRDGVGRQPQPPPMPPWEWPQAPRCQDWQRPSGSTLYPSDVDRQRAQFTDSAQSVFSQRGQRDRAAGAPRQE